MSVSKREIPPEVVEATLRRWAAAGETNIIPVSGHSMRPLLQDGDAVRIAHGLDGIGRGDIIVFRQHGGLVVHRVVRIDDSMSPTVFVTKGDNVRHLDAPVSAEHVLGRVLAVVREDGEVAVATRGWRVFGRFLAITALIWAIPFSKLRQWKRKQVGTRFYRPIQAISKLYLLSTNAIVKSAEMVLNRSRR
jgi:signal peptidase I